MDRRIFKKIRLGLYSLLVLIIGGTTGFFGSGSEGVAGIPRASADVPGDGGGAGCDSCGCCPGDPCCD